MNEEQRLILKMLEEGKITAAEAEALLNALKDPEATVEEERHTDSGKDRSRVKNLLKKWNKQQNASCVL